MRAHNRTIGYSVWWFSLYLMYWKCSARQAVSWVRNWVPSTESKLSPNHLSSLSSCWVQWAAVSLKSASKGWAVRRFLAWGIALGATESPKWLESLRSSLSKTSVMGLSRYKPIPTISQTTSSAGNLRRLMLALLVESRACSIHSSGSSFWKRASDSGAANVSTSISQWANIKNTLSN